jgi:glutamate-5-semialdehyde dehydrogenase
LDLTKGDKYDSMLQGVLDVAALEDPMGKITLARHLDTGLDLYRVSCPVGVILVIFEARPEVIANISALAIKSGNSAILKGGKESLKTFTAMSKIVTNALTKTSIPWEALQLVDTREQVGQLLSQDKYIDLVIPRGSNELVRSIKQNTKIPVLGHADGLCIIYIHDDADLDMACRIVVDAKTNYPAGCNAVETVLINEKLGSEKINKIAKSLIEAKVMIKAADNVKLDPSPQIVPATEQDFHIEFLSLTLAMKTVVSVEEAITHINEYGSHHTDCIITESKTAAEKFLKGIDSAGVYWNASTRFADGFRYGFGTEVGVSTNKIHARGPMGLEGLMCYQYLLKGTGQVAGEYVGAGGSKRFNHQDFTPHLE